MPTIINNSTFLDAYGAGQFTSQQYQTVAAATLSTDARVLGDATRPSPTFSSMGRPPRPSPG